MLHRKTVEPNTLSLIYSLQSKNYTNNFLLVWGTALALQIGHRTSTDIDFFSNEKFDVVSLLNFLREDYNDLTIRNQMSHAVLTEINNIKSDFVFQSSILIDPPVIMENIRMASMREIAAMKISAIVARGKKRDFVDLYCLLNSFSLSEILKAFKEKYKDSDTALAMRSLFYYVDADQDLDPKCFFDYDWEKVKKRIHKEASKI
jgi:predicted nucleotidyltransferase component of viral defense system